MNRLDAFVYTMEKVLEWKYQKIDEAVADSDHPEVLLEAATLAKARLRDKRIEWETESILVPHLRQRAIDSLYVIDIIPLMANPAMEINAVPTEGISSTTVGEPEGERE